MNPIIIEVGLVAASVGGWSAVYGVMLLATRPRAVTPAATTPDLGTEPPAVVSLVANGWRLTEEAAEATLLDLGARRYLEFRQPDADPSHTTVHLADVDPSGLHAYERRVLDRVRDLAVHGVVPLTALTFRDEKNARSWWRRLRAEVVADARSRGLSRRRFGPAVLSFLGAAAVVAGVGVALAALHDLTLRHENDAVTTSLGAGFVTFTVLSALAGRSLPERDTPAGREAAARWLGVKSWLAAHDAFADLPPSAVTVWDRYLAYGAALGTTRVSSAVIDLGMGNRKRLWSSYGGTWHRVRVRYPRFGAHYGATAPALVFQSTLVLAAGFAMVRWWPGLVRAVDSIGALPPAATGWPVRPAGIAVGVLLLGHALHGLVRTIADLAAPVTRTGQVLWSQVWRRSRTGEDGPSRPVLHYLAIDDGAAETTRAWALPSEFADRVHPGDTVTITVRPWSRRIGEIRVLESGSGALAAREATDEKTESLIAAAMGAGTTTTAAHPTAADPSTTTLAAAAPTPATPVALISAEEASRALGTPVSPTGPTSTGPVTMTEFRTASGAVAMHLLVASGMAATVALRARSRHPVVPGIGERAHAGPGWAVAGRGQHVVSLQWHGPARDADPRRMLHLLSLAAQRLPGQ